MTMGDSPRRMTKQGGLRVMKQRGLQKKRSEWQKKKKMTKKGTKRKKYNLVYLASFLAQSPLKKIFKPACYMCPDSFFTKNI